MRVYELIARLKEIDQNKEVFLYDHCSEVFNPVENIIEVAIEKDRTSIVIEPDISEYL